MSDYELIAAYFQASELMALLFSIYLTILFAAVLVGWFVGQQMEKKMLTLLIGLFSFAAAIQIFTLNRATANAIGLMKQIITEVPETRPELGWITLANANPSLLDSFLHLFTVLNIMAYAATIYFILLRRGSVDRTNRAV